MYACLAVTCHLHFWQNDQDLLRATVVTQGWNGYRNKSQHRKSTLEKKILPPFQQGFEPVTFQSRVRRSNHWAIPAPSSSLFACLLYKCVFVTRTIWPPLLINCLSFFYFFLLLFLPAFFISVCLWQGQSCQNCHVYGLRPGFFWSVHYQSCVFVCLFFGSIFCHSKTAGP